MLTQKDKKYIVGKFGEMTSKDDLLELLNYSKKVIYGPAAFPISLRQINYYSNPKVGRRKYHDFEIAKKSGGVRVIHAPVSGLKVIQRCLSLILSCIFQPHPAAMGFTASKSIFHNANVHVGNFYVYNVDLKDFFPSIDQARVWKCLQIEPFNLTREPNNNKVEDKFKGDKYYLEVANIISAVCCTKMLVKRLENGENIALLKNVLPQGAPTSPLLSNVICKRLDYLLTGVAKRFGLKYSRYADDITFSSLHNVFQSHNPFIKEMRRVITDQGFIINEEKVRLQKSGYRQVVTGLTVNEKVNVSKSYIKELRRWLYLWETYGYTKAANILRKKIDTVNIKTDFELRSIIRGKIAFLKDILGSDSNIYQSYNERFSCVCRNEDKRLSKSYPVAVTANAIGKKLEKFQKIVSTNAIPSLDASYEELREFVELIHVASEFPTVVKTIVNVENDAYHNPIKIVSYLKKFSEKNDLKYTTHLWDGEDGFYDFITFKNGVQSNIRNSGFRKLPQYNSRLYWKLIYPFIIQQEPRRKKEGGFFEYGWGKYKLKLGFFYPSVLEEWMVENPGKMPFEMPIPKEYQPTNLINGKSLIYFEDFVDVFKNSIEFRKNDLFYLLKSMTDEFRADFKVELNNLKGLSFFTDTHQIEDALRLIFLNMRKFTEHPNIEINGVYDDSSNYLSIEILHRDSYCDKPVNDEKLNLKNKMGDFYTLKSNFNSLCDWSIESRFRENNKYSYFRFDYLGKEPFAGPKAIPTAQGFKHILKFYL